ncbi:hypothetical protein LIER_32313 [Lithospermum erythrorhizon]|uniref:Uncharacterized protein n=1 Tax=Lithospermum erythrorhizon TaxID=34254 RepID=A0AAV3RWM0_LITER
MVLILEYASKVKRNDMEGFTKKESPGRGEYLLRRGHVTSSSSKELLTTTSPADVIMVMKKGCQVEKGRQVEKERLTSGAFGLRRLSEQ